MNFAILSHLVCNTLLRHLWETNMNVLHGTIKTLLKPCLRASFLHNTQVSAHIILASTAFPEHLNPGTTLPSCSFLYSAYIFLHFSLTDMIQFIYFLSHCLSSQLECKFQARAILSCLLPLPSTQNSPFPHGSSTDIY